MNRATRALEEAGLKVTAQRTAIVGKLERSGRPITAQALHAQLRRGGRRGPGLATVYRTLQVLAQGGWARTFPSGEGEVAYRLCTPGHHHHLICESCGEVVELSSCGIEDWAAGAAARQGYEMSSHQADVFGRCPRCA